MVSFISPHFAENNCISMCVAYRAVGTFIRLCCWVFVQVYVAQFTKFSFLVINSLLYQLNCPKIEDRPSTAFSIWGKSSIVFYSSYLLLLLISCLQELNPHPTILFPHCHADSTGSVTSRQFSDATNKCSECDSVCRYTLLLNDSEYFCLIVLSLKFHSMNFSHGFAVGFPVCCNR